MDNNGDAVKSNGEADSALEPSTNYYVYEVDSFVAVTADDLIDGVCITKLQSVFRRE